MHVRAERTSLLRESNLGGRRLNILYAVGENESMRVTRLLVFLVLGLFACTGTRALASPGSFADLQSRLDAASQQAPGHVAIAIENLATGSISGINTNASMPAASTIKIPVMVEVFEQMALGKIELDRLVHLQASDRDWGFGDLCDAPAGKAYSVSRLLRLMITESDNTATNMLIRLVGRQRINATMHELGLSRTSVADYIRSEGDIRSLRSSPRDMVHLLDAMAREQLVDVWSSRQMLAILEGQRHNTLLPAPLPPETKIAHKTGTLHDTLNDVGIVETPRAPYVIAVMTTHLPSLASGRSFIRGISKLTYDAMERFADWREQSGIAPVDSLTQPAPVTPASPDLPEWMPSASSNPPAAAPDVVNPPAPANTHSN